MVPRTLAPKLLALARKFPVVTVTGPRQAGKTTLCRAVFPAKRYVSLEAPDTREYALRDPRAFLAEHAEGAVFDRALAPADWFGSYVGTYVERDVRQMLNVGDLLAFQTFLRLCAGRTAQLLNLSALAADGGITHGTARAWLSVLEASFVAFRLPPFHSNVSKRLVKTPKLHFYDTGLVSYLLGIRSPEELRAHPLRGAIFESWVASEIVKARVHRGLPPSLFFFRDRKGAELDGVLECGEQLVAVETKSGQTGAEDFFDGFAPFDRLVAGGRRAPRLRRVVVYGGNERQKRTRGEIIPWSNIDRYEWAADAS